MLQEVDRRIEKAICDRDKMEANLSKVSASKLRRVLTRSSTIDLWNDASLTHMVEITQLEDVKTEIESTLFLPTLPYSEEKFQILLEAFEHVRKCERIWDVTGVSGDTHYKSSANEALERVRVSLGYRSVLQAHPKYRGLHFPNSNGPDIIIYPRHMVLYNSGDDFGVVSLKSVIVSFLATRFQEDGYVPSDSIQAGSTWTYVNQDGSPDRRFAHNPMVPIMLYGDIGFTSPNGLNERVQVSNLASAAEFVKAFNEYSAST